MENEQITVCSGCGRKKVNGGWTEFTLISETTRLTHGLCEDCVRRLYPDDADWIIKRARDTEAAKRAQEIGV